MPTTAKEAMTKHADSQLCAAMDRLLYNLRQFVGVYPVHEGDRLPEHDVQWMAEIDAHPGTTIIDAVKANPVLWRDAVPAECCIVHRATLEKYVGADAATYMADHGDAAVAGHAARLRYEAEQRDIRKRYEKHSD